MARDTEVVPGASSPTLGMRHPEVISGALVVVPGLRQPVDPRRPAHRPAPPRDEKEARCAHRWWANQRNARSPGVTDNEIEEALADLESKYPGLAPEVTLTASSAPQAKRASEKRKRPSRRKK